MSHCNITRREKHSMLEKAMDRIVILEAEKRLLEQKLATAESNLDSLFERVRKKETVWLEYADGTVIYVEAARNPGDTP